MLRVLMLVAVLVMAKVLTMRRHLRNQSKDLELRRLQVNSESFQRMRGVVIRAYLLLLSLPT
jgi:hypothetical protein